MFISGLTRLFVFQYFSFKTKIILGSFFSSLELIAPGKECVKQCVKTNARALGTKIDNSLT